MELQDAQDKIEDWHCPVSFLLACSFRCPEGDLLVSAENTNWLVRTFPTSPFYCDVQDQTKGVPAVKDRENPIIRVFLASICRSAFVFWEDFPPVFSLHL